MSDREDFEDYVAARRPGLVRTAYLLTGSHHEAEDLVQATLLKVVPKWPRIADHPEPYVRKVLSREAISRWRRRRWREVTTDLLPETPAEGPAGADEDLRRALLGLSPRQRAVIVLRYYEDLTEQQTADRLGIRRGTVKSHARDALARLREVVGDEQALATRAPGPQP